MKIQKESHLFLLIFLAIFFSTYPKNTGNNRLQLIPIITDIKKLATAKKTDPPIFIAISGCSCVGKTFFADRLAQLLEQEKITVAILHLDDFFNPLVVDPLAFNPYLEHQLIHTTIQQIQAGVPVIEKPIWPEWGKKQKEKTTELFNVSGIDIILFEGVYASCTNPPYDFAKYAAFSIFIDANDEDIIRWRWIRSHGYAAIMSAADFLKEQEEITRHRAFIQSLRDTILYRIFKDKKHRYRVEKNLNIGC